MKEVFKFIILKLFFLLNLVFINFSFADNHNIYETLEIIKNDLKTLERAVYSGSIEIKTKTSDDNFVKTDTNSEDVLTRHLLKLSEVENQFRELTNKFEEINFLKFKTLKPLLDLGSFFCHFYNHKSNLNDAHI